ncbi:ribonuclease H-like domain, gag-pre-integrase domain protein [Tanacetum coccineum]
MEMEHYLEYIDNEVWKVIQNGNSKKRVTKGRMYGIQGYFLQPHRGNILRDEKERKARTLLLIGSSKSSSQGVFMHGLCQRDQGSKNSYAQLDALGAGVSDEDANHKFLRSEGQEVDGKSMWQFDKRKVECFNCHNTGHFARESSLKFKRRNRQEAEYGNMGLKLNLLVLLNLKQFTVYSTSQTTDSEWETRTVSDHSVNDDPNPKPSIEQDPIATPKDSTTNA